MLPLPTIFPSGKMQVKSFEAWNWQCVKRHDLISPFCFSKLWQNDGLQSSCNFIILKTPERHPLSLSIRLEFQVIVSSSADKENFFGGKIHSLQLEKKIRDSRSNYACIIYEVTAAHLFLAMLRNLSKIRNFFVAPPLSLNETMFSFVSA